MADIQNILIGGVSTTAVADYTIQDLAPNNYLTIVWHNSKGEQFDSLDIDDKKVVQYFCDFNNALEQSLNSGGISYVGQNKYVNLESIAKYLAQNIFKTSPQRTVVNALIGLISGGTKKIDDSTINLIINMFGGITDKVARKFGFSDPHEIFASFMSENTIQVLKEFGDRTQDYLDKIKSKFSKISGRTTESIINNKKDVKYVGLLLGLTTSDTESYEISIPRKKVENGSDYTTHLLPQNFKKDFTVKLTNKVLLSDFSRIKEIEQIEKNKDKLIEIANSKILFDIYIRLSSDKMYKRSNVYFSSLSFSKDENSGDGYECTFSIEPVKEFKTKTFVSDRKYFPTASKPSSDNGVVSRISSGFGNGIKAGSSSNRKTGNTSSKGNKFEIQYLFNPNAKTIEAKNWTDAICRARQQQMCIYFEASGRGEQIIRYVRKSEVVTIDGVLALERDTELSSDTQYITLFSSKVTRKFKDGFSKNTATSEVMYKDKSTYRIYQ